MKTYTILKSHCQYMWYVGTGNFWFEKGVVRMDTSIGYRMLQVFLFTIYITTTIMEILGSIYGDFPKDEHGDCVTFSVSHTIVMIKIFSVIRHKKLIRKLNQKMVDICEEYENELQSKEKYRIIKINIYAYVANVYGAMVCFIFEGVRKMLEGSHFVTVVTYYPSNDNNSPLATTVRVLTTIILAALLLMMISIDSISMTNLILFKYKIITLREYFEGIRETFDKESKISLKTASQNLRNGLVKGIKMHGELISICEDIDTAFGTVMTMQLCLSSGSAVSLLLQLALATDLTFVASVKIITFVFALYFLLALFLCNAGDITYQAFQLSEAIFYCGWHMCESSHNIGPIVVLSMKQAQKPLVMKSFKMIHLTHGTFLQVVRSTYSVFALFYAQNQ